MSISIVVPIYNSLPYLDTFFSCLSNQTFTDYQAVFVYDKSNDGTFDKLRLCVSRHPNIKSFILEKPIKEGVGKARDFALDSGLIKGKYVLFLDCDDTFEPNFLADLYNAAEERKADIVMCGYERIDERINKVVSTEMVHNPDDIVDLRESTIIPYLNPAPWNKLYRFDVVKDARFVYPGGGEDEMFFLKVLPNCHKISFINKVLYHYALHAGSVLSNTDLSLYEKSKEGYESVVSFYRSHGQSYLDFWPLCEACIFVRFGIGMTTRTCLSLPKAQRKIIKGTRTFFVGHLLSWKRNKLLSFSTSFKNGLKALFIWRCRYLYKAHCFGLFVSEYRLFTRLFHKDIKW
jgi:glycosyltransferase involved in cell wall biosynthesis